MMCSYCPGTVRPPRWNVNAPPTRTCKDWPCEQSPPDQWLPRVVAERTHHRAALPGRDPPDVRAAWLRLDPDPCGGADRAPFQPGRGHRQGDLRGQPPCGRLGCIVARPQAWPALRPDGPVRALRPGERGQADVPVPPLPDPAGMAW